jgi:Protein of unknown function (DUF2934)
VGCISGPKPGLERILPWQLEKGVIELKVPRLVEEPSRPAISRPWELEEIIRRRAFEIFEERGKVDGYALDDWLLAEAEIMTHHIRHRAA